MGIFDITAACKMAEAKVYVNNVYICNMQTPAFYEEAEGNLYLTFREIADRARIMAHSMNKNIVVNLQEVVNNKDCHIIWCKENDKEILTLDIGGTTRSYYRSGGYFFPRVDHIMFNFFDENNEHHAERIYLVASKDDPDATINEIKHICRNRLQFSKIVRSFASYSYDSLYRDGDNTEYKISWSNTDGIEQTFLRTPMMKNNFAFHDLYGRQKNVFGQESGEDMEIDYVCYHNNLIDTDIQFSGSAKKGEDLGVFIDKSFLDVKYFWAVARTKYPGETIKFIGSQTGINFSDKYQDFEYDFIFTIKQKNTNTAMPLMIEQELEAFQVQKV